MLGYDEPGWLIGKKMSSIHPHYAQESVRDIFRAMAESRTRIATDIPCIKKDGTIFHVDIVSGDVHYAGRSCLAGFFLDITEKRTLQAQLERARKMEAIGLLAGGVAHDLNNILSGIVSYPELMLLQVPPESSLRPPLIAIHESGKRAAAVVSDLLTVARGVASTKEPTSLNALILEYLSSPEHVKLQTAHAHITCSTNLDPHLANITCSPVHIKKCLLNLVMNAMEAISGAGAITLTTSNQGTDDTPAPAANLKPAKHVVLAIGDTGHGIKQTDLDHIFEPFYTRKVLGRSGTGLGLAVVWNSMQDHGGAITVESGVGGTVFRLFFPASVEQLPQKNGQTPLKELYGNGESILVVDDEPQQLDIAGRILEMLRYRTLLAGSGEQAIALLEHDRADLILLDMIMPSGISGLETFKRALRISPDQKALIVSGFADSSDVREAYALGARGFIKKPYSIEELGKAVKEKLLHG